jgi:uncharacterized DUF497 family protein
LTGEIFGGTNILKITFDRAKRAATRKERGLDFVDAAEVFAGRELTVEDSRRDHGERRYQTVGHLAGRMVMVVWTPTKRGTSFR